MADELVPAVTVRPVVSVIIPAYNAERYIGQTIDSVLAQTYRPLEVIVADDGSTDGTRALVLAYGDRVRYLWQANSGGAARPRNHGIGVASGEFVAFLDADDLIAADRVAAAIRLFDRQEDIALVFTNFQNFDDRGVDPTDHFQTCPLLSALLARRHDREDALVLASDVSAELLLTENFGSSAPIVRRAAIEAIGGFDETTPPSEDFDFNYRIAMQYPIAVIPQVMMHKRAHGGNLSANLPRMLRAQILVRSRLLKLATAARHRRTLRKKLALYHKSLAYYYTGRDNGQALRYAFASMRYSYRPSPRHFARILADIAGRDTNGERSARTVRLDAGSS